MNPYVKLALMGLFPVIASVVLYVLTKKTAFGKINRNIRQVIYGVIFGGLAVIATEFGVKAVGVTMNVRDAAPICAGLIFGAPAGIIAGVIGGVERFLAAYWGAGTYTQIACSVSTAFSGVFAAWMRKYMFDDKRPSWVYGLVTGLVCEVTHMLMVFITNLNDAQNAFIVVEKCTIPMVSINALAVMTAVLLVSIIGKEHFLLPLEKTKLAQTFQRRLLVVVVFTFILASGFTYVIQSNLAERDCKDLLTLNLRDVESSISEASDKKLLSVTRSIKDYLIALDTYMPKTLLSVCNRFNVSEINIIDKRGRIAISTNMDFQNFDMHSGEQSQEFLCIIEGDAQEYVQSYQALSYDSSIFRKYAAAKLPTGGMVQVGYDAERFQEDLQDEVENATHNRHIGNNGYILICDGNLNIVSDSANHEGMYLSETGIDLVSGAYRPDEVFEANVLGVDSYVMYQNSEGYYVIGIYPVQEAELARNLSIYITIFMEILVFSVLFILIYFLIKQLVVKNIMTVNDKLGEITNGNLEVVVDVRTNEEFASLSDDINSTVVTLKRYIAEAAARIDQELEFARTIQASALPREFPPFPARTSEFDIWAGMKTAKEVGGDFYDFYLIGEDKLAFLIADVSGKGIPAAMFMMTSKTMIKNLAESGIPVNEVFTRANEQLCESNDAGLFVTAWMGILELKTGHVTFANAGHNPPLLKRADGQYEYLHSRPGLVLAGMEGLHYRINELQLEPGDEIYLYTDGVTEATDAHNELFGEDRLLVSLNDANAEHSMEELCRKVKKDVDAFVGEAPQFDDITMVGLHFLKKMDE